MEVYKKCTEHFTEYKTLMPNIYVFEGDPDDYKRHDEAIRMSRFRRVSIQSEDNGKVLKMSTYNGPINVTLNVTDTIYPVRYEIFRKYLKGTYDSMLEFAKDWAAAAIEYATNGDITNVSEDRKTYKSSGIWHAVRNDWIQDYSPNTRFGYYKSGIIQFNFEESHPEDMFKKVGELILSKV